tara:strand:+ start:366 stop:548 length:183 start_codon:yes stop_codon:yes gene_type:complete
MYEIIGTLGGKSEVIDTAKTKAEAESLFYEYRVAFGPPATAGKFDPQKDWSFTLRKRAKK